MVSRAAVITFVLSAASCLGSIVFVNHLKNVELVNRRASVDRIEQRRIEAGQVSVGEDYKEVSNVSGAQKGD